MRSCQKIDLLQSLPSGTPLCAYSTVHNISWRQANNWASRIPLQCTGKLRWLGQMNDEGDDRTRIGCFAFCSIWGASEGNHDTDYTLTVQHNSNGKYGADILNPQAHWRWIRMSRCSWRTHQEELNTKENQNTHPKLTAGTTCRLCRPTALNSAQLLCLSSLLFGWRQDIFGGSTISG